DCVLDAGLGADASDHELRQFVVRVLATLRLICYYGGCPEIPTEILRKLAAQRREQERPMRQESTVAKLRFERQQAGLHINPAAAECCAEWRDMFDPYDFIKEELPPENQRAQREDFARGSSGGPWVLLEDLPDATLAILRARDFKKEIKKQAIRKELL